MSNCHCNNCENHYKHNGHVEYTPEMCAHACKNDAENKCKFSLYNKGTAKCYFYDREQAGTQTQPKIAFTSRSDKPDYTCYDNRDAN